MRDSSLAKARTRTANAGFDRLRAEKGGPGIARFTTGGRKAKPRQLKPEISTVEPPRADDCSREREPTCEESGASAGRLRRAKL